MKETFVVLREESVLDATRDVFTGTDVAATFSPGALERLTEAVSSPAALAFEPERVRGLRLTRPRVTIEEMDPRALPELTQEQSVRAVAPSIPLKLITPVERRDLTEGKASKGGKGSKSKSKTAQAQAAAAPNVWGIHAVGADTSPYTGAGVVVAVLDTGIDPSHPAFSGVTLVQKDFSGEGDGDHDRHGTHCAGTIFGRDVGGVRIGIARDVQKALIGKVLGEQGGSSEGIARAIMWAVQEGAQVISMSLGIDFPGLVARLVRQGYPTAIATSIALEGYRANVKMFEALAASAHTYGATSNPVLLVAAAGNESQTNVNKKWKVSVAPPAVSSGFMSVAAVGQSGGGQGGAGGLVVAPFSNTNANIAAPGVDIVSARAGGGSTHPFTSMSGTSMATPHVAGVAALWAEKLMKARQFSLLQFQARVAGSASLGTLSPDTDPADVGLGLISAPQT